jgi:hypothetical protein
MKTTLQVLRENISESAIISNATKIIVKAFIDEQLENEKQQLVDFGNKMQMVSDVDCDGNIKYMFQPEEAFFQMFKK